MKSLSDYKLVFWDFDGVIKDSVTVKTDAFSKLFEKYGEKKVYYSLNALLFSLIGLSIFASYTVANYFK